MQKILVALSIVALTAAACYPPGTPGVNVTPTSGLVTNEAGGTATFEVVLNSEPTEAVTIQLTSSDLSEGTVSPSSLTFDRQNWRTPQTVTITGVDDASVDGNQTYTIMTMGASSKDGRYEAMDADDIAVTNTDNDTAGFVVSETNLTTTEAGATATFTVRLTSQPSANVTIPVSSSNPDEGTVAPASLVFTELNWNAPQTVTVTGVNDSLADGAQTYTVLLGLAASNDPSYKDKDPADVTISNTDDDTAGVTVAPVSGLTTTEAGGTATFTVKLNSQPKAPVTFALASGDTSEGIVSPAVLTFTPANWNAPQTVTATGVDDTIIDGNQAYVIVVGLGASSDADYNNLNPSDVSVTNVDNDTAGVTILPSSGLVTTEAGDTAVFTVVLNAEPTADVTIALSSSDTSEGTVSPASLTFTPLNWSAPQTVTITGVNDSVADGNQPYTITTAPAVSDDVNYKDLNPADVEVTNVDNDSPGVTVTPVSGLTTTEAGGTATFTVRLNSQPAANVTIDLSSSDTTEGTIAPASLTFTSVNWNAPQTVTITGVEDSAADGNQAYTIVTSATSSTDPTYNALVVSDVSVTNVDNDTPGVTVTPTSGLSTTEAGGTATFTIQLNTQPTADVTITLSSNDTTEGTISPTSVTFTTVNWNAPQTITVTGQDDPFVDGNQVYVVVTDPATSSDSSYNNVNPGDVSVTNVDDETAGFTITPNKNLYTTEGGGTATFTIKLNAKPTGDVTFGLTSSDTTEGTVTPASLTFTTDNWNAPQTVTAKGVNDPDRDGNQPYLVVTSKATSSDPAYNDVDPADVPITNIDDETAGFIVTPLSGLKTTEAGGSDTFTIRLTKQPTQNVTINLSSSDTSEGTVAPASVVFTASNWDAPQTVTVTGADDAEADGDQLYSANTSNAESLDLDYAGLPVPDVAVTNTDNDSPGITVEPTSGLTTTESGGTATFTIKLNSQPTANVTIGLSSSDITEGTVSPASVTFNSSNWNAPQTVTVTGVDDSLLDGNQPYTITTAAASSADTRYNGRNPADVSVTNNDNDTAGFTISPTSITTTEAGGTGTFTVRLNTQPSANVTISLSSSDTTEGTVAPASLTFTSVNWNSPQTVTVTGVNDQVADGDQTYTIITSAATSADPDYNGIDPADVQAKNTDNDSAGFTVTPTTGLTTTEVGGTATFTIRLNSQPTADVTIALSSNDTTEGTVSPASVTFNSANWNSPQTVTVTGVDDQIADGSVAYLVVTAPASSSDPGYNTLNPADVSVSNTDNDTAGFTVTPTTGLTTTEAGGTATFTIKLNSQPTADVTVALSSSDTTEGTVSPTSVTFTPSDWSTPKTVTVTGVDDQIADGSQPYTIVTAAATSSDPGYNNLNPDNVSVSNTDNDSAGFTVTPTKGLVTSENGGSATFTVRLNSQPTADVTVTIRSGDLTEGLLNGANPQVTLTFSSSNWSSPQTVTVNGVDDLTKDGDQVYMIILDPAASADSGYNTLDPSDVEVTNQDNDPI